MVVLVNSVVRAGLAGGTAWLLVNAICVEDDMLSSLRKCVGTTVRVCDGVRNTPFTPSPRHERCNPVAEYQRAESHTPSESLRSQCVGLQFHCVHYALNIVL